MKKEKIWKGRIGSDPDAMAESFTASIGIDKDLFLEDLTGTAAYVIGLENIGIINRIELKKILAGLKEVKNKIVSSSIELSIYEDIHSLVEGELTGSLGEIAGKIHTGRSRNDQIVLDELIFVKRSIKEILLSLLDLERTLLDMGLENEGLVFCAYTHMQKAQPVLVTHYLFSFFERFARNIKKLLGLFEDCDYMPLGAGACTGSGYPINTGLLAEILKFGSTGKNSMDIVSNRDFMVDFAYCCTMIMLNLSRFCEDLIIYNSQEFSYINIDESFCTGSSIMPQKKNPDILELIKGKSAVAIGNIVQILTLLKGLPSTYNSDMQEDKKIILNARTDTLNSLKIFTKVLQNISFNKEILKNSLKTGHIEATDAADYLVKKGETFRKAHNIIGKIVGTCLKEGIRLKDVPLKQLRDYSKYFGPDFYDLIDPEICIESKVTDCGTSTKSVSKRIKENKKRITDIESAISQLDKRIPDLDEIIGLVKL